MDTSTDHERVWEAVPAGLTPPALFSEIRRVLRSGGTLALSTPAHSRLSLLALALSRDPFGSHFDPRSDHVRFYSRGSLRGLLGELGFEDVHVRARGHAPRLLL